MLPQVHAYMTAQESRWGFVLTPGEVVGVERVGQGGHVKVSQPISWDTKGSVDNPKFTVELAL